MSTPFILAIHGGAGTIAPGDPTHEAHYHQGLVEALRAGHAVLVAGGSALDAVCAAVVALEDCPLFNAGHGAVLNAAGEHELDAGLMSGIDLRAGAVAAARLMRNPILAARSVMHANKAVLLAGRAADDFARRQGLGMVTPDYFTTPRRLEQWQAAQAANQDMSLDHDPRHPIHPLHAVPSQPSVNKMGTVGAVALDSHGHLAAATSTGGMTMKPEGRVGDTPIVGAGVYANDATCAVSATGTGEHFIRACVAYDIHARMRYQGLALQAASERAIHESLAAIGGRGGVIAVSRSGELAMPFNSTGMYRGWWRQGDAPMTAIFDDAVRGDGTRS